MKHNDCKRRFGFTLIELLVAVVIVGILAAVAYPSYLQNILRSNRSAAQSAMMDIANREQQYLVSNRKYGSLSDLNYSLSSDLSSLYTLTISTTTQPYFLITMTPQGTQASDGPLTLDSLGVKAPASKW